jgi:shikimate kinase
VRWGSTWRKSEPRAVHGSIADCIQRHGYLGYAARNVRLYAQLRREISAPTICALSSGFMLYPEQVEPAYPDLRRGIEEDALTALLLPSFDPEKCAERIVGRQMSRPYLDADSAKEMRRIRDRLPAFMRLACERFASDLPPAQLAANLAGFIRISLAAAGTGGDADSSNAG